jgi:hypothetical protein
MTSEELTIRQNASAWTRMAIVEFLRHRRDELRGRDPYGAWALGDAADAIVDAKCGDPTE